jgi:hypothetical protein
MITAVAFPPPLGGMANPMRSDAALLRSLTARETACACAKRHPPRRAGRCRSPGRPCRESRSSIELARRLEDWNQCCALGRVSRDGLEGQSLHRAQREL